jgi:multidrug efflux pump subunit AcrB
MAAHLRFRPIIMTSLAFILGVLPLAIASGAGSASHFNVRRIIQGYKVVFFAWVKQQSSDKAT